MSPARHRAVRLRSALCVVLGLAGCGARSNPCTGEQDCPTATTCQSDGRCAPLALSPGLRAARGVRLFPSATRSIPERADAGDLARLGGPSRGILLLSFTGLVPEGRDAQAELVIPLHEDGVPPATPLTLVVDRVRPPGSAGAPAPILDRAAERVLGAGARGAIRIDVSRLVRTCARAGVRDLDLALRVDGPGELLVTSARNPNEDRRPHLDVYVP